eukprot:Nitzschia sp. Nitz4//scaffold101_size76361//32292//33143//NITZ4_005601-RA/size76361-processed-gene-0.35-mRNA-1//-1//CDS//3329532155//8546//frame0
MTDEEYAGESLYGKDFPPEDVSDDESGRSIPPPPSVPENYNVLIVDDGDEIESIHNDLPILATKDNSKGMRRRIVGLVALLLLLSTVLGLALGLSNKETSSTSQQAANAGGSSDTEDDDNEVVTTLSPTASPTSSPTSSPTTSPTASPTMAPTAPTASPTEACYESLTATRSCYLHKDLKKTPVTLDFALCPYTTLLAENWVGIFDVSTNSTSLEQPEDELFTCGSNKIKDCEDIVNGTSTGTLSFKGPFAQGTYQAHLVLLEDDEVAYLSSPVFEISKNCDV